MRSYRYHLLAVTLTLVFSAGVAAQHLDDPLGLVLLDDDTGIPVEGAFVRIEVRGESRSYISSENGKVEIDPFGEGGIWIQHVNYEPFSVTLNKLKSKEIRLIRKSYSLNPVVVTGQYRPQSAENSVYNVRSVQRKQIQLRGAADLGEVLTTLLNVRLQSDPSTGGTSLSLQGISGENIKVLIDGVPVKGRVANQIDLNQFNINQIETIEIVEGPMSVSYGTNALGGVINIITQRNSDKSGFLAVALHEASIGSEYGTTQGIHNQSLSAGGRVSDKVFAQGGLGHNYFGGFQGASEGRSTTWDPKRQLMGNLLTSWNTGGVRSHYKIDILKEEIDNLGEITGIFDPIAIDDEYKTSRVIHQWQTGIKISSSTSFDAIFGYTDYDRRKIQYIKQFSTGERNLSMSPGAQDSTSIDAFNFRGSLTKYSEGPLHYQIGYDINLESANGGRIEGPNAKRINDLALFGSLEASWKGWKLRPGVRIAKNTAFRSPIVPSLNFMKRFGSSKVTVKGGYGFGFRAPDAKELYLEFVDSNHRILGNSNLTPEKSHHLDTRGYLELKSAAGITKKLSVGLFYNQITDKIDFGQSAIDPTVTTYINVGKYESLGGSLELQFSASKMTGAAGVSYTGISSGFAAGEASDHLFSPELNGQWTYTPWKKWDFAIFYKYTGRVPFYQLDSGSLSLLRSDPYHWMDLNVGYRFTDKGRLGLGLKNVFDITNIQGSTSGTHGSESFQQISYGRSAFVRLSFEIPNNSKSKQSSN